MSTPAVLCCAAASGTCFEGHCWLQVLHASGFWFLGVALLPNSTAFSLSCWAALSINSGCVAATTAWLELYMCCEQVLSPLGRCLVPPLQLGAAPAFLVADQQRPSHLLAVSVTGTLRQWDLAAWQCCQCDCPSPSVSDLLAEGQTGAAQLCAAERSWQQGGAAAAFL